MKNLAAIVLSLLATTALSAQDNTSSLYGTGEWNADSLGNHRVVVSIEKPSDAVLAKLDWRRRDLQPEAKDLYIIDAQTGKRIENVFRFAVNREEGDIVFQPQTVPGKYCIYYMKYVTSGSANYPTVKYPSFKETASSEWLNKNMRAEQ